MIREKVPQALSGTGSFLTDVFIDLSYRIDDPVVHRSRVLGANSYLNKSVENLESLAAAVGSIFDGLSLRRVKGRPVRVACLFIHNGLSDG